MSADNGAAMAAAVRDMAEDVVEEARHLLRLLNRPDAPLLDPVEQAVNLSRSIEALTAGLVGRARLGRVPWAALGPALAMQPDTARRSYRAETVSRRIHHASRHTLHRQQQPAVPATSCPAGRHRSRLAPVLARLHRASQMPLRALAARLGISPSYASQILSGERFPNWWLTEELAKACGADPLVLRKVWEDEKLREDQPPGSPTRPLDADPT
ncbi:MULTISPECIES: helix-turn-helix transcriptional regulator [unclassified Streptomyces]|uniref:helix-turn-helix transcriptional regulator n=1 Tax=unclassified Streptomyces TaxID=2593676 RepID=UPI002E2DDD0D|nr:helix-turn-helix transcriptional regulator [Streptomyces sp. NBC_00223]